MRGSKPPASTEALRQRLKADAAAGKLQDVGVYAKWLVDKDSELGLLAARRVVSRELRAIPKSADSSSSP